MRTNQRAVSRRHFLQCSGVLALASATVNAQGQPSIAAGTERVVDGIRFRWCPPGRFLMGSPVTEPGRRADEAPVEVTLSRGFWMATLEATQGQWSRVVGAYPDRVPTSEFGIGDDVPMYWVNYLEADQFCATLTERARRAGELPPGWAARLPTEAQWEYACRAGTTTATSFGTGLRLDQANVLPETDPDNQGRTPHRRAVAAGMYPPNPWGLRDMHGNIFEWCRDWYHAELPGGLDPDLSGIQGVQNRDGTYSRVRRGGAWNDPVRFCRSGCRFRYEPERRSDHIGFRVVLVQS